MTHGVRALIHSAPRHAAFPRTLTAISFLLLLLGTGQADTTYPLSADLSDTRMVRVKTILEIKGSLRLRPLSQTKATARRHEQSSEKQPESGSTKQVARRTSEATSLPIEARSELFFDQRGVAGWGRGCLRHYWEAAADLTINQHELRHALRKSRNLIQIDGADQPHYQRFRSPLGPLTREELELVQVTGSGLAAELLLPADPVALGATWPLDDARLRGLLGLDAVSSGSAQLKLAGIDDKVAKLELSGEVEGVVEGVATAMRITGQYHFDRQAKLVTWWAVSLKEKREPGFAAPGFDVVARIRSARESIEQSSALTADLTKQVSRRAADATPRLEFISEDEGYRLLYDRRWVLVSERGDEATFRFVDEGDLIATCRIERLNTLPAKRSVPLATFQRDVQNALGQNCEQIVETAESTGPRETRILRVVASGKAAGTPIRWIYYHISNNQGRRLSCIFTHEAARADRFAGQDEALADTVELLSATTGG